MPPMTRPERAARIAQLREQLAAITEEINRLMREDEAYVAYAGRAQAARQNVLPYPDFARYVVAYEQFEAQWAQAGRPSNWERLPVLMQLREALLVPAQTTAGARPVAVGGAAAPGAGARPAAAAPAVAAPTARPAGGPAAPAPAAQTPSQAAPPAAPVPAAVAPKAAARSADQPNLAEQHSPILNEVVELAKRAEEEFRLAQLPAGLASVDRAVYLLERVYHAPPALVNRVVKLLDDAKGGAQIVAESDRERWDKARSRAVALLEGAA
jgi:hypothetical protein